ncbi:MAG: deoxyribonuclease IV [Thermoplasmata archaeon]|uniref:Probable endonuclease 4 n=1 Tax=Candidatus Sysuiplasma superficiale TaxID=2823368 RepID=A0A8J7YIU9_9ARCH|nr:deoxyribonuclease IV [Candidatus Sysuiplasma superficiale]MBX8643426.1 deoxyribonuclease IV [Candidatus Sysuiplasma superficiale]
MLIGAHVGIGGGFTNAVSSGLAIKADIIQIFTRNQMQWKSRPLDVRDAERFRDAFAESGLKGVIAHGSYLINLAGSDAGNAAMSVSAVVEEMRRCDALGIGTYIFHPGSHRGAGEERGITNEIQNIGRILDATADMQVKMAVETMAGQGDVICSSFESIARIIEGVDSPRIGVCLDTCHVFAAGYDVRTAEGVRKTLKRFREVIGFDRLLAVHLNDSKAKLGSRVDRHENIGKGEIGKECFRSLMHTASLSRIPMALETPGGEKMYSRELRLLRKL